MTQPSRQRRLALLPLLAFGAGSAATQAADRYVAPTGSDAAPDFCARPAEPCASIQHAADVASAGDTIRLAAGTYLEIVTLVKSLGVIGAGAAVTFVDGGGLDSVFNVDVPIDLELADLTIRNGDGIGGGAVRYEPEDPARLLLVRDCVLSGNAARIQGGAIFGLRASVRVERTRITGNRSAGTGGGIDIANVDASLLVVDSLIDANTAGRGGGGLRNHEASLTLVTSRVTGNDALVGGALQAVGPARIERSTLADNSAGRGGAIDNLGSVSLIESTLSGNVATGSDGFVGGGGVFNLGPLEVTNSTLSGNRALARDGGAIDNEGLGSVVLTSSTVYANRAEAAGRTSGIHDAGGSVSLRNSILAGHALAGGAACLGELRSEGHNLIEDAGCTITGDATGNLLGVDPGLGPLADNGGPTATHAPALVSPTLDAGDATGCADNSGLPLATDQRGLGRAIARLCGGGPRCDIGAVEVDTCASGPTVYEAGSPILVVAPPNAIGTALGSPFDRAPPAAPSLFYALDNGAGFPLHVLLVKGGPGLRIFFF